MTSWSKLDPALERIPCKTVVHPWTDSCVLAATYTWVDCAIGSVGFYGLLYLCQYVSKVLKKRKKTQPKDFLLMILRSTVFGGTISSVTVAAHCIIRRLIGRYYYLTTVFIPSVLGGLAIYLESRKTRELYANAFANSCLEILLKLLERSKILRWNSNIQTALFMAFSSAASFLLSSTNFDANYFWFFMPPKVTKDEKKGNCFHDGSCRKNIFNLFAMYSSTGLVLQYLKLFLSNFKNPIKILPTLIRPRTFKLAAFLGSYAVIYQVIRCYLYQKEKKYSLIHDSIAGFLAGVAFRFQPTIAIFNSAVITVVQVLAEVGCRKKILPDIPYLELIFPIFSGLLFHFRILTDFCPPFAISFMSGVTHGYSDKLSIGFKEVMESTV